MATFASVDTPIGRLGVVESQDCVSHLLWACDEQPATSALLKRAVEQLTAYFDGGLTEFDLPLCPSGSAFQQRVYTAMLEIPRGETRTYGELAKALNTSAQPVGNACGANPIPIIIPCHRVLATNGLGGYSGDGGIETKIRLLRLEQAIPYLI